MCNFATDKSRGVFIADVLVDVSLVAGRLKHLSGYEMQAVEVDRQA